MSDYYLLFNLVAGVSFILMLPGPTNTLLFSAGVSLGVWRTLPLVAAEALGYVVAISLWGFVLLPVAAGSSWLLSIVKLVCASYIGFLALKMWSRGSLIGNKANLKLLGPADLFMTTLSNPKGLVFVATVFPAETFNSLRSFVLVMTCFLVVLLPIGATWSYLGALFHRSSRLSTHTRTILRLASGVLVLFSGSLIYSAYRIWIGYV
jgi:threonine/homoserine/homoserine lactone efflux protein